MSDFPPPPNNPPSVPPSAAGSYRPLPPPPRPLPPPNGRSPFLGCAFALSFAVNLIGAVIIVLLCLGFIFKGKSETGPLTEQHYSGKTGASDKVAVITLDGVLLEGLLSYAHKQIEQAAADKHVKAVVVRINSPGGSITASDDLHRKLLELRDGNSKKNRDKRPLIVSMGAMAASGGYYVAMPGQTLFAETTTVTGSIGVYSSFPNVKELADKYGVKMNTIKQGQIKDSGSPFADMTPHERQVWQDMVDTAYKHFLGIVETGRPMLANGKLLQPLSIQPVNPKPDFLKKGEKAPASYTRYLADGGVWTADNALKYQLVDKIGTLDEAVQFAHDKAGLGENYETIKYERPGSFLDALGLGAKTHMPTSGSVLDPARLEMGFAPRMWYLMPGAEVSSIFAAMRE
jgi:protease-4